MRHSLTHGPTGTMARIDLEPGESFRADSAALVSYQGPIAVTTDGPRPARRAILKDILSSFPRGNESFFTNTYTALDGPASVFLAPWLSGEIHAYFLQGGENLLLQASAFLAAAETVHIDTEFQGFARRAGRGTPSFLRAIGEDLVLLGAFGAVQTIDLDGELLVDAGHLLALTSTLRYAPSNLRGGRFFAGESLLLKVHGTGRMFLQTRNPIDFATGVVRRLRGAE